MAHDGDDYIEVICEFLTSHPSPAPPAIFAPPPLPPVIPAPSVSQCNDYIEFLGIFPADPKTPVAGPSGLQAPVRGTKRQAEDSLPEPAVKKSREEDLEVKKFNPPPAV